MCEKNPQQSLIDFSSPLQERLDFETFVPLVPSPQCKQGNKKTISSESELFTAVGSASDEDNNPFDLVDHQTNLNIRMLNDPFEIAFYLSDDNAQGSPGDPSSQINEEKENLNSSTASELVAIEPSLCDGIANQSDQSLGILNERMYNISDNSLINISNVTDPCKDLRISLSEISTTANVSLRLGRKTDFDNVGRKIDFDNINLSLSEEDARDEGNGSLSSDSKAEDADDSDQALKAIIANRVTACIQNALQQSRTLKGSYIAVADSTTDQFGHPTANNASYLLREYPQKENSFTANSLARKTSLYETDRDPVIKSEWKPVQRRSLGSFVDVDSHSKPLPIAKSLRHSFSNLGPSNLNYSVQEILNGIDRKNTSCVGTNSSKTESFMKYYEDKTKHLGFHTKPGINYGATDNILKNLKNEVTNNKTPDGFVSEPTDKDCGNDSVFLEANNLAFMFRSFTFPASDGEDDILTCKPQWETSYLKLPELSSDEDEPKSKAFPEVQCKEVVPKCSKEAHGPPDIVLQTLMPLIEKNEAQLRIKPKQMQQVGKKGPMKAIVPLGNMVRTTGFEKKVSPSGSRDQLDVDSSPDLVNKPSEFTVVKTGKETEWESDDSSKNRFANRSFTSTPNPSPLPTLRRSSSLTSGIPGLSAPAVSLKSQFLPQNSSNQNLTQSQKSVSEQSNKSSGNVGRFSLPGFVATSTPAKKVPLSTPNRLFMKSLPSPIPVKGSKDISPVEVSEQRKSENNPKNKSFDGSQQSSNEKILHEQQHNRSKSASNTHSSRFLQNRKGSPKEVTKSNVRKSLNPRSPPELKTVNSGILKPLKINGQSYIGRQIADVKKMMSIPGNEVKRSRPLLQMFSKHKSNSFGQVDKENMKPA